MGILDKLKPQPRWKHMDPAVRLEALRELDDPVELAALAETDPDAKIRRAATTRIADPAVLGRIVVTDPDAEARDRAADRLLALAMASDVDEGVALEAARSLNDPRRLSTIAKSDAAESVRSNVLARITEERALSSIARHAKHEATASAALDRLTDAAELLEVALHGDHRDVALQAFERVAAPAPDLGLLRSIETRAQQKAVGKRARALIQEIEEAEAARRAVEEERQRQIASTLEGVERLADLAADLSLVRTELERLIDAWQALDEQDAEAQGRFERGTAEAQATIARRQREADEAAERARVRAEAIATADALCTRVETLDSEESLEQLVPIEEEWRSLAPLVGNGPEADRLAERFATAMAACRTRHDLGAMLAETRARLEALVVEAEGLLSHGDAGAAAARWHALAREARGLAIVLADAARPDTELSDRLAVVDRTLTERETAKREATLRTQQEVAGRLQRLVDRARRVADAESITLREGERLMRDISAGLDEISRADASREIDESARALRSMQETVAPRVRDLREMDEWRRFANGQQQEQLIAMAEAIVQSLRAEEEAGRPSDLAATARALKELHARWSNVAEGPRQQAQRLWDRFRTATDFIRSRCEGYFTQLREQRVAQLQKKAAIVEEAEALAASSDWGKATARLQELQTAWQQTGPAPREAGRDLAHRFRTACNQFFSRRRDDLVSRKKVWADNLARKEALCERAEALVQSTEWEAASAEIKRLQAEWKTIGPVRRSKSDAIWARFRGAADQFFERYHHRHQIAVANKLAERETLVLELEQLAAADEAPADLAAQVQQLRTTWSRSVPIPAAEMQPLTARWHAAFALTVQRWPEAFKGSDLDAGAIRQRMEKLVARVEALVTDTGGTTEGKSQTEILAERLRSALASNAMGGRASDESKWRSAADTVKEAQIAWQRLAPLPDPVARTLEARFRDACRRVQDHARKHTTPHKRPVRQTAAAV
jgi:Domain of Unknown Function (DUF349)